MNRLAFLLGAILAASVCGVALATEHGSTACARGYSPCLPVVADLDCDQIPDTKKPVRVTGSDPYGLDRDRDGLGCEVSGKGGGSRSPWGLILRKGRKEATSARIGDTVTVVGWSPRSFKGVSYSLCNSSQHYSACEQLAGGGLGLLKGTVQTFGTWKISRRQVVRGFFKLNLRVKGTFRAHDTVPVR